MCLSSTQQRAVLLRLPSQLHKGNADCTQSCYFRSGSLQSVGVMLTALRPRANKALYLEEIATSSCDLHKIVGSLMLTTLTIENQAVPFSPLLSIWSLYLKGTLRLSPWSWEPWGRKWGTKSQNEHNDSLLLPLLHEVCAGKVSRCRHRASLWLFHSQATRLSNKDSKIPHRQEMQYNILGLV